MVKLYIDGGFFMHPILITFILGLAIGFTKIWTLWRAGINTRKFIDKIRTALQEDGTEKALEICKNTRGSVASIFHAGLMRVQEGIDYVEKSITSAGSIEMSFLERHLVWLGFIIVVAPLLGFTGTVWGMIVAFDAIRVANDISPAIVAGGISQALITTLGGLIVAMFIQLIYNWSIAKIDQLVIDMEEASVELIDTLVEMEKKK